MGIITKLAVRIVLALILSVIAAKAGIPGNTTTLNTLFTVEGIMFSVAMSMLVCTNLTEVLNDSVRKPLRDGIIQTRRGLIYDFAVTALIVACALYHDKGAEQLLLNGNFSLELFATAHTVISFLYEIRNFSAIHKLNSDLEERIIEEKKRADVVV